MQICNENVLNDIFLTFGIKYLLQSGWRNWCQASVFYQCKYYWLSKRYTWGQTLKIMARNWKKKSTFSFYYSVKDYYDAMLFYHPRTTWSVKVLLLVFYYAFPVILIHTNQTHLEQWKLENTHLIMEQFWPNVKLHFVCAHFPKRFTSNC